MLFTLSLVLATANAVTLFGYYGCSNDQRSQINQAFTDAHTLAAQQDVRQNINWLHQSTNDMFGFNFGTEQQWKDDIQDTFSKLNDMAPGRGWQYIRARCDDPLKRCPCRTGSTKAYADSPLHDYSYINFCPGFFQQPGFAEVVQRQTGEKDIDLRQNIDNWGDNQAVTFLHEMTHLDYFMKRGPYSARQNPTKDAISDYWFWEKLDRNRFKSVTATGADSKILARYVGTRGKGYYPSTSAENYAYFAMGMYARSQIGDWPYRPIIAKTRKPHTDPIESRGFPGIYYYSVSDDGTVIWDGISRNTTDALSDPHCEQETPVSKELKFDDMEDEPAEDSSLGVLRNSYRASVEVFGAKDLDLRIFPVGDAMAIGEKSTTPGGYIQILKHLIEDLNNTAEIVTSIDQKPNVVLMHVGRETLESKKNATIALAELIGLLNIVVQKAPDAAIYVARIVPSKDPDLKSLITAFNEALPDVIASQVAKKHKVFLANLFSELNPFTDDYGNDNLPTIQGYGKMALGWYKAITWSHNFLGYFSKPADTSKSQPKNSCSFHLAQTVYNGEHFTVNVKLSENGKEIANVAGKGCDVGNSYHLKSTLADDMVITCERVKGEYIQFTIGSVSFPSDDKNHCVVHDWAFGETYREMDCSFEC